VRVLLLLLSFSLFSSFVYAGEDEENASVAEMEYLEMKPKFTVNLKERRKYLMVNAQLLIEGEKYIDKVKNHMPMLRHQLIMLFSDLSAEDLETMQQREDLRIKAKRAITDALDKYENSDGFRDIFFTEFLVN
jgi:flagellar protein FliL